MSAEPFGSPPQPVPLDLLDLPPGLTSLELRNIDVTSHPAGLEAAAAAGADFTTAPVAAGFAAPQGPPCPLQQQQQGVGAGVQGVCSSGASRCDGGSSGAAVGPGSSGGGARAVLQQLERFQLESCRLRAPQLKVGALVITPVLQPFGGQTNKQYYSEKKQLETKHTGEPRNSFVGCGTERETPPKGGEGGCWLLCATEIVSGWEAALASTTELGLLQAHCNLLMLVLVLVLRRRVLVCAASGVVSQPAQPSASEAIPRSWAG